MQIAKKYISHICDCTQCPNYKVLIDIPWNIITEQKKFDFPVGFCNDLQIIIKDFSEITSKCKLENTKLEKAI